jgi:thiosulfate/3-mercaptopyruvate sulfurtransferase
VLLPRSQLLDPATDWFKPLEQQRELLEGVGVNFAGGENSSGDDVERVVLYCNGGVAACTAALALERLGYRKWAVFDGSWNEWGGRQDLPVEVSIE